VNADRTVRIAAKGFALSAKSPLRLRLSADGKLVKDVRTGRTWATLRPGFDPAYNDHLFAALKALNMRLRGATRAGIVNPNLLVTFDRDGGVHIGMRFVAVAADGTATSGSVPAAEPNRVTGYRLHRSDPAGWRETVAFCVNRALVGYANTPAARQAAQAEQLTGLTRLR
jgi:hypothetical protein